MSISCVSSYSLYFRQINATLGRPDCWECYCSFRIVCESLSHDTQEELLIAYTARFFCYISLVSVVNLFPMPCRLNVIHGSSIEDVFYSVLTTQIIFNIRSFGGESRHLGIENRTSTSLNFASIAEACPRDLTFGMELSRLGRHHPSDILDNFPSLYPRQTINQDKE
jgi:hypothetical protein